MRLLAERNEHLTTQLEALRAALRGGAAPAITTPKKPITKRPEEEELKDEYEQGRFKKLSREIEELKASHGADVGALVAKLQSGEEALSKFKAEARRHEAQAAEAFFRLAASQDALVGESVHVKVPQNAVPGSSQIMVRRRDEPPVRMVVPLDATPGSLLVVTGRELEELSVADKTKQLEHCRSQLSETAAELGLSTDKARALESEVTKLRALVDEASQLRDTSERRTRDAERRANIAETRVEAAHASLTSSRQVVTDARNALEAANAACDAARDSLPREASRQADARYREIDAEFRAHKKHTVSLLKDLRAQLKREKEANEAAERDRSNTVARLTQKMAKLEEDNQLLRSAEHQAQADASIPQQRCEVCAQLAQRLEQLLRENAHAGERIAFLEASVRDLNSELHTYRDNIEPAMGGISIGSDGGVSV